MDYGYIIQRGFTIVWENKFLWVLGFLAALGGSSANGNFNANFNFPTGTGNSGTTTTGPVPDFESDEFTDEFEAFLQRFFGESFTLDQDWQSIFQTAVIAAVVIVLVLLVLRLILFFIRLISEGGMIQAVTDIEYGGVKTGFQKAFSQGRQTMVPILVSWLILSSPFLVLGLIMIIGIGGSAILLGGGGNADPDGIFAFFPLICGAFACILCVVLPYGIISSILYPVSQRGIVLDGMRPWPSIQYAWQFFETHLTHLLIWSVIYVVIGTVISIITAMVTFPIIIAVGLPIFFSLIEGQPPSATQNGLLIGVFILVIIISALINAIAIAYRSTTFTLVYHALLAPTEEKSPNLE